MLLERYYEVSQASDVDTFRDRLVRFANDMEFPLVSADLVIEAPNVAQPATFVSLSNASTAYQSTFTNATEARRDPVMQRMRRLSVPFVWDQGTYVSEGVPEMWEEQAAYGYRTGVAVALHLPGGLHFLLGVDRPDALPRDSRELTRLMADLQLLAVHAQDAATRLLRPAEPAVEAPRLSQRELEVMQLTMHGKSSWTVGQLLSISEHTVNFHIRNVLKKLDCASKHQAVLKLIGLGQLK